MRNGRPDSPPDTNASLSALSDVELLTTLFRASPVADAERAARRVVACEALGEPDAVRDDSIAVRAACEWRRRVREGPAGRPAVFDRPEVVLLANQDLVGAKREHFAVLLLTTRYTLLKRVMISVGSLSASIVHPREVFRPAIRLAASAILVVHNHPSGDPRPSRDDVALTKRLVRSGVTIGVPVLDHVIVARDGFYSMREAGVVAGTTAGV